MKTTEIIYTGPGQEGLPWAGHDHQAFIQIYGHVDDVRFATTCTELTLSQRSRCRATGLEQGTANMYNGRTRLIGRVD